MKRLLITLSFFTLALHAVDVQNLLEKKEYFKLLQEMELLNTHESMETFPLNAHKGTQLLLTNDYHLRQLWEFDGSSWNAWENDTLNLLLNRPEDILKQKEPTPNSAPAITFKQLESDSLPGLQNKLHHYLHMQNISQQEIVSIQFFPFPDGIRLIITHH